ncbi:hypothetical protein EAH87_12605 [Sphingomonas koreensis]|nr:hypothetical protein EAH87_12605 [Sphingomonas koreensis]
MALPPAAGEAAPAAFDLAGPGLRVSVTHDGATLPIAQVPNLAVGDSISIAADLPPDQGARYLLVASFLRDATNPPPKKWFFQAETWQRKKNSLSITVPEGARQLIVFLMPKDGGDFDAIVNSVRKQPGTFVRASQELNQASLDRARLDAFLAAVRSLERSHPDRIAATSPLLTRSLSIKLKAECLDKPPETQAACLTDDRESLLLADSHSSSLAETLVGAPTDLAFQLSSTAQAGYGAYSPYIGAVRDIAHIFGAFEATQLQYIPALGRARDDRVGLLLNAAPSFGKPLSVMVVALPAIEAPTPPPLRRTDPDQAFCAARADLVLPVEGAPLIYATHYAHDMVLRVTKPDGSVADLPVSADAGRGGYVLASDGAAMAGLGGGADARLHGKWGFAAFDGPHFRLQSPQAGGWKPVDSDPAALVIGRDNGLTLQGAAPSCIDDVSLQQPSGAVQPIAWKQTGNDRIAVTLPLAKAVPGKMTLLIRQHGAGDPVSVPLTALAEAGRIDGFTLHAGDASGALTGTRLDTVASLTIGKLVFKPGKLERIGDTDQLTMLASDQAAAAALTAGQAEKAKAVLADGRSRAVSFVVAPARPSASLVSQSVVRAASSAPYAITLADPAAVTADARLTFSIRAEGATRFAGSESVEIATADGRAATSITAANGFTIQNDQIAVISLEPAKALGVSAFGPLRFRVVQNGVAGDWAPLTTLVRLPRLTGISCKQAGACTLSGADLFLLDAVAGNPAYTDAAAVPEGFTGASLSVPKPTDGRLYLRLRDAPALKASVAVG